MSGEDDDNVYPFPSPGTRGGAPVPRDRDGGKKRASKASRLSKTAAGLALIVGTGGGVASLNGADLLASQRGPTTEVAAAGVVDIMHSASARKTLSDRKKANPRRSSGAPFDPGPPDDGGGPSAA